MPPRPDVVAAAHAHSLYGKTWSSLGRSLDPITQDVCAFYDDHSLFTDFTGFVYKTSEGERIAEALGNKKAECFDYSTANWIAHGRLVPNSNRYGPASSANNPTC
jgi:ribulose-5-phosphate 4-epimerase/fuculose-1-phosphate aldolase